MCLIPKYSSLNSTMYSNMLSKHTLTLTHTFAISFLVQQKLMKVKLTKSAPQQIVTVFSSKVSCEPIVTICLNLGSYEKRHNSHDYILYTYVNIQYH